MLKFIEYILAQGWQNIS